VYAGTSISPMLAQAASSLTLQCLTESKSGRLLDSRLRSVSCMLRTRSHNRRKNVVFRYRYRSRVRARLSSKVNGMRHSGSRPTKARLPGKTYCSSDGDIVCHQLDETISFIRRLVYTVHISLAHSDNHMLGPSNRMDG
jgi:hypothetical protein